MPYTPDLSYSVTRFQEPTLNHAGNAPDNPLMYGVPVEIRLNKWNKDVRLKKAWITTEAGKIYKEITNYLLPPLGLGDFEAMSTAEASAACAIGDGTTLSESAITEQSLTSVDIAGHYGYRFRDSLKYLLWRIPAQPPFLQDADSPQLNILHITTTNGYHTPIRYRHMEHTDSDASGMYYDKSTKDRPGGTQSKCYLYVSANVANPITLDGYNGSSPCEPVVYPVYPKGSAGNQTFKTRRDYTEPSS